MALLYGDPAPTFATAGVSNPRYVFDSAAGRYLLLAIVPAGPAVARALATIERQRAAFNDAHASAFIVIVGKDQGRSKREDSLPGLRFLFDEDGAVAALYGATDAERWCLVDPALHVMAIVGADQAVELVDRIAILPPPGRHGGPEGSAPVLLTPRIFEPAFCEQLIALYRKTGGQPSGFMREVDGVTTLMTDDNHKRRSDVIIENDSLQAGRRPAQPSPAPADPEGLQLQGHPDRTLSGRPLRCRNRRLLPSASRQHHQGHGPPAVRGLDQSQRGL